MPCQSNGRGANDTDGIPAPRITAVSPERRIDITISRLAEDYNSLSDIQRAALADKPWFITIETVFQLRAMERAEEEVLGRPASHSIADAYDRVVAPGERAPEALIRSFQALLTTSAISE